MAKAARELQVFAKPGGAVCNLECRYCYYLGKERLYPERQSFRMPDGLLEATIVQHIEAAPDPVIRFSWHGGAPGCARWFFRLRARCILSLGCAFRV
jgi:sulfatase maturation enzyme AslB (radical SAM superfamily)